MSKVPPQDLEIPEFQSLIPVSLLHGVSEREKHILETLSIIQQQNAWLIPMAAKTFAQATATNGRVLKLEDNEVVNKLDLNTLKEEVLNNGKIAKEIDDVVKLFSKKWFLMGGAVIGIFIAFFVYPYLLTVNYKDLIPVLKSFFG